MAQTPRTGPGPWCPPQLPLDFQLLQRETSFYHVHQTPLPSGPQRCPPMKGRPRARSSCPPHPIQNGLTCCCKSHQRVILKAPRLRSIGCKCHRSTVCTSSVSQKSPANSWFPGGIPQNCWESCRNLQRGESCPLGFAHGAHSPLGAPRISGDLLPAGE